MDKKSLKVIRDAIRHARDTISLLAIQDYPNTPVEDEALERMFYDLNHMSVALSKKINGLEAQGLGMVPGPGEKEEKNDG